jgi:hypothetical protein
MASPTLPQIEKVLIAEETSKEMVSYVATIVCNASVIAGDRYKVTFSEHSKQGDEMING